jgi:N-acetylmuramoyl-L-alanine amidase
MRKINKIIIHCTATPEGRPHTIADITRWHKERGFNDIGYHFVVGLSGETWPGRTLEIPGAHAQWHNADSIGVCYVGGMSANMIRPKDTRTSLQKESMLILLRSLKRRFPEAEIIGHRDVAQKDCPSFDAKTEYQNIL